jgi:hypothetical protein
MVLTRVEMRYKRPVMNELEVALGHDKGSRFFDDPYVAVDHTGDLWGFGVGLPPEHDHAPDVTQRGWMRLTIPDLHDSTRTRWSTDPLWEIIQRVPFSEGLPKPLRRAKHVQPDLDQLGAQMRGYFISWAVLRESYRPGPASLARELEAFEDWAANFEEEKGMSFAEDVRERARLSGKKVPYQTPLSLPRPARGRKQEQTGA